MKKLGLMIACLVLVACSTVKPVTLPGYVADSPTIDYSLPLMNQAGQPITLGATIDRHDADIAPVSDKTVIAAPILIDSVYFDYDQDEPTAQELGKIQRNAIIIQDQGLSVILEGNADERGSHKYNMSLGLKRAERIKQILVDRGVSPDSIQVISLGKESPKATCHNETCWRDNRRVDFVK
jgi:outer membrane protein OmpA-like peptidoglycan-associated protein